MLHYIHHHGLQKMRPLSTRVLKTSATYEEILASVHTHEELKKMRDVVLSEGVCFFIYRGRDDHAIVMMKQNDELYMSVCPCPSVLRFDTDHNLLYAMCYGV